MDGWNPSPQPARENPEEPDPWLETESRQAGSLENLRKNNITMRITRYLFAAGASLGLSVSAGLADSISPTSFDATLDVGESVTITKRVTVDAGPPTSSKVDVFFLADDTGSMGGAIGNIQDSALDIITATAGLGDVAFAVGRYGGETGISSATITQDLTKDEMDVQDAINDWVASGGGDEPEANLYGLHRAATETSWRDGSERILVWFGDAPGHDPSPAGGPPAITEDDATDALLAAGINVQAVSVGFNRLDLTGQATRITSATGGTFFSGVATADIVDVITDAISTAVSDYSSVGLDLSEVPAGVTVDAVPDAYLGDFDRSVERTFDFEVTFTGDAPGVYSFPIHATVDGGRVATEDDRIVVRGSDRVPDGGQSVILFGLSLLTLGAIRKKLRA